MHTKTTAARLLARVSFVAIVLLSGLQHSLAENNSAPDYHFLLPGFTVRQLPIELTNINDLVYAPDGRLFALGYDSRVHVLTDTDGDGLEDTATLFWETPNFRMPIQMAVRGNEIFITANGKVVALKDTDGDGTADEEETVVSGWPPVIFPANGVDAMGLTVDRDGFLYVGLGCQNFFDPWLRENGKTTYSHKHERGTILRVSRDGKTREIFCTGLRFPTHLEFNKHGDLFGTDQEGATWVPNGNPSDELNHLVEGRHYGFPPRHPEYLPDSIDDPPVVEYMPQHQSSCGIVFNSSPAGDKWFGPADWRDDAIVCGFSRGKIWRTKLVKTPAGYVGRPTTLAIGRHMTLETAVAPDGSLAVTTHYGVPDWGVGPEGIGKLFKITYVEPNAPQPVAVWPVSSYKVAVAFDQPITPEWAESCANAKITYGEYVRAGDRHETLKPPYQVVLRQRLTTPYQLRVTSASLAEDGRTVIINTDPHPVSTNYAIQLPFLAASSRPDAPGGVEPEVDYTITGVEAEWKASDGSASWSGWLPHVDPHVTREMTRGSAMHDAFFAATQKAGELTLRTRVEWPPVIEGLRLTSTAPFTARDGLETFESKEQDGAYTLVVPRTDDRESFDLTVSMPTGGGKLVMHTAFTRPQNAPDLPVPLHAFVPLWAPAKLPPDTTPLPTPPEMAGGDWERGRQLFLSDIAKCSTCHRMRDEGGDIGPNLSNLVHRDAASVLRDIADPSAVLHPDYVAHTAILNDGRVLTGFVHAEGEHGMVLRDITGKEYRFNESDLEVLQANRTSLMPEGLAQHLGEDNMRHLLTFLLTPPPSEDDIPPNAPRRTREEVQKVLDALPPAPNARPTRFQLTLCAGPKDHGPGEHDYVGWQKKWGRLFTSAPGVEVQEAFEWPDYGQFEAANAIVIYNFERNFSEERLAQIDEFLKRGGGLVLLHSAMIPSANHEALAQRIGLTSKRPEPSQVRVGPIELTPASDHPIMRGVGPISFVDETYFNLIGDRNGVEVLATSKENGEDHPIVWAREVGKGRVFVCILGHYRTTFDDPLFRTIVMRGIAWAGHTDPARFHPLVTEEARFATQAETSEAAQAASDSGQPQSR